MLMVNILKNNLLPWLRFFLTVNQCLNSTAAACNFEFDLCYWSQDLQDGGNWKVRTSQGEMDPEFNGPVGDHTTGSGRGKQK